MKIIGSLLVGLAKRDYYFIKTHSFAFFSFRVPSRRGFANKVLHDLLVNMPKEPTHLAKLKGIRKEKKETMVKYPAGFINLQVLGNGSKGAPNSLYVFTDQTRYIFNCGEGTQRLAHEHKTKLAKLEHVFITSKLWNRIGGLPGLILTIQDIGVPAVTVHGPPVLYQLFEGTKGFVILKDLQIRISDCTSTTSTFYQDHVMKIEYVPLFPRKELETSEGSQDDNSSDGSSNAEDNIDYYAQAKGAKRPLQIVHDEVETKKTRTKDSDTYQDCTICYICRPKEKAGQLIIEKCVELGVPSGPLLGKLKAGEDVILPNGKLVKAEEVTTPHDPGPIFIVVDCPDIQYIDSLVENDKFAPYQNAEENRAHVVVHFTPKAIMEHPKYINWLQRFQISTQHLIMNDLCEGTGSEAVHRVQHKLNQLDQEIFPLLGDCKMPIKEIDDLNLIVSRKPTCLETVSVPLVMGSTLLRFNLRPSIGLDTSHVVTLSPDTYLQETTEIEDFASELEKYKLTSQSLNTPIQEYPKIIFLGTGSCIPNKTRNTSGILIQLSYDSNILLDCGEGTFGQFVRFFGTDKLDSVLTSLKAIYISHLHADHHLGLINVILERVEAFNRLNLPFIPITLIAPRQISPWLKLYHKKFEKIKFYYELVPNGSLNLHKPSIDPEELNSKILQPLNLSNFQTVGVRHCPNAFGVAFSGNDNWKLTYSGDTMPSDYLVILGQNSDVLIHEATMEDDLKEEAVYKMHSTTSEAIAIGKKMNAKFTMLTHFSQRYAKVPKIGNELEETVGIAFDNMCVRLSDLPKIPLMYPALKTLFAEHYEEMEIKTAKKMKRREKLLNIDASIGNAQSILLNDESSRKVRNQQ